MCWMCSGSGEIGKVHTIAGVEIDGGVPTIMKQAALSAVVNAGEASPVVEDNDAQALAADGITSSPVRQERFQETVEAALRSFSPWDRFGS